MKTSLAIFALVLSTSIAATQHLAPLGKLLDGYYPRMSDQDTAMIWVYFTDKGVSAGQKMAATPTAYLSERAIQRRQRALKTSRVIDMQDVPLEPSYVDQIKTMVRTFRHEVKWFNVASAIATKAQIEQIRMLPFVSEVDAVVRYRSGSVVHQDAPEGSPEVFPTRPDTTFSYGGSLTQNQQINTVAVHNLGITGQGVLIGIFDDSFPNITTHPALATRTIIAMHDFVDNDTVFHNNDTHGQETFSTIGGFQNGSHIGPAFGASFVLARTEQAASETPIEEDNWARAIIWADSIGIDVSSTSLGYNDPSGGYDPPWPSYSWSDMNGATTVITRAADRAAALGITVVNSAGNAGDNASHNTLGAPADGFNVITAGAVTSSGARASFSAVGPTADGRIKPDIMAMGSGVQVALGTSGYTSASGTSFSCPLSAGVAALVISGNLGFNLTPFQVREAMRQTASQPNAPDRLMGWGILNAFNAMNYPWIEHTPLTNSEDTTSRLVLVRIKSRVPLVMDSTRVLYGIGGSFTNSVPLVATGNPNEYSAHIPYLGPGANVTYYIRTRNQYVATRLPLSGSYNYQVGQDLTAPAIAHRNLGNQALSSWPPVVSATVTDDSGVDTVKIQCKLNGVAFPVSSLPLVNGVYTDTLHVNRNQLHAGDTVSYRILATDRSRQHNLATYPVSGEVKFAVLNTSNWNTSFDGSPANFTGTSDWQWGTPSGTSPHAHSGTQCWGTILSGSYSQGPLLSSLNMPLSRVFSNRASFSYWQWQEIQSRYDGGNVKISVNHGAFQVIQPVGGYQPQIIYTGFGNPLGGQAGFSGVGGTSWSKATFDLTGIAGEGDSIVIRFDFGADNGIQYRGWYIDDFTSDGITDPASVSAANLGVDRDTVDFGTVPIGRTDSSKSVVVTNLGQTVLNVTNVNSSNPAFGVNRTSFSLNYLDTLRMKLYFTALAPGGQRTGTLTFTSNSTPPSPTIRLRATSVGQAHLVVMPDTFYFSRQATPDTTFAAFKIFSTGTDTLRYTINESNTSPLREAHVIRRSNVKQGDSPGGPASNRIDIGTVGMQIMSDSIPWMSTNPTLGALAPGDSQSVSLRIHPFGLTAGLYTGYQIVGGNTTDTIGRVRVRLNVTQASGGTDVVVGHSAGWNLISNPVGRAQNADSVRQLYPGAASDYAFGFVTGSGYQQTFVIPNGPGYWVTFPVAATDTITGTLRTRDSISVFPGWNIVGSISNPVDTGTIVSVPPGLQESSWFGYSSGYNAVTQLIPGKGYWVKSSSAGKFVFANPPLGVSAKVEGSGVRPGDVLNVLTVSDSRGGSQTLYFGADAAHDIPLAAFGLPPVPPARAFDARFSAEGGETGSMVRTHAANVSGSVEFPVTIQSDAYPVTVTWKLRGGPASYELTDGVGGRRFRTKEMRGEGSMTITNRDVDRFSVKVIDGGELPGEFTLQQNYPNPFNPSTTIRYGLPGESHVSLRVFNLLGQAVAILVEEDQKGGYRSVEWNATGFASGVYFYRLDAGSFTNIRKLVLLK